MPLPSESQTGDLTAIKRDIAMLCRMLNRGASPAAPAAGGLIPPPTTANALHFLRVNSAGTGYEYRSAMQVLADIGAAPLVHAHDAAHITSGILSTARGGTGLSSFAANRWLWASSASALSTIGSHWTDGASLALGATALAGTERLRVVGGSAPTAATTHDEVRIGAGALGYTRRIAYIGPTMSVTATGGMEVLAAFDHTLNLAATTHSSVSYRAAHAVLRLYGPAASVAYTGIQFGLMAAAVRGVEDPSAPPGSPGTVGDLWGSFAAAGHHWGIAGTTTTATCLHVLALHRSGTIGTMHVIRLLRAGSATITTAYGIRDETGWPWAVGGSVAIGSSSLALGASDERLRVIGGAAPGTPPATEVRIGAGIVRAGTAVICEPRGAPASPVNGMIYYDSAAHKLRVRANGVWVNLH